MLTATDTHYLVGLLSELTSPDNVELELGSMVFDEATQSDRDVDITIRVTAPNQELTIFKAIEVKALRRKVGSQIVEQLALKLSDMPSVDRKAIVSASGFTAPAIRKAKAHDVELYELKEWSSHEHVDTFGHILLGGVFTSYQWHLPVQVRLNPGMAFTDDEKELIQSNPLVHFADSPGEKPKPLLEWLESFRSITASELQKRIPDPTIEESSITNATVTSSLKGRALICNDTTEIPITELEFKGRFEKKCISLPGTFKALYRVGSGVPVAGCCVSELPDTSLMSLAITTDKLAQVGVVPLSERNARRLLKRRFEHS